MTAVIMVFVTLAVAGFLLYPWLRPRGEKRWRESNETSILTGVRSEEESRERIESGDDE